MTFRQTDRSINRLPPFSRQAHRQTDRKIYLEGDTYATYLPLDAAKHPVSKILYYSRAPRHPTHQVFSVQSVISPNAPHAPHDSRTRRTSTAAEHAPDHWPAPDPRPGARAPGPNTRAPRPTHSSAGPPATTAHRTRPASPPIPPQPNPQRARGLAPPEADACHINQRAPRHP